MCGIVGMIRDNTIDPDEIRSLVEKINYRGPDDANIYLNTEGNVAFGHARLSIVDVKHGKQPILNETGHIVSVINGEIYNYMELRKELVLKDHILNSYSDSEIIPHIYEEYGIDMIHKLNGQFAFCIYDARTCSMYFGRDPFGEKPLYYVHNENGLIVSSDISSLKCYVDPQRYDIRTLKDIITTWGPISDHTIYQQIHAVMPGEYIEFKNNKLNRKQYYTPKFIYQGNVKLEKELQDELEMLLLNAIENRITEEVDTAYYLSGGIDSSLIVAMAKKITGKDIPTFSINIKESEYSESKYQKFLAEKIHTKHNEINVGSNEIIGALEEFIIKMQQPLTRIGALPMYFLSRYVKEQGYKVVLSGEGADELFGGYDIFKESLIREFCEKKPNSTKRPLLYKAINQFAKTNANSTMALKLFYGQVKTKDEFSSHQLRWKLGEQITQFIGVSQKEKWRTYHSKDVLSELLPQEYQQFSLLGKAQYIEIQTLFSNYLLTVQGDRVSMAHGLECRYPFLDKKVVEFALRLQDEYKIRGLTEKYLLRKVAEKYVPQEIVHRRKFPYRATIDMVELLNDLKLSKYLSQINIEKTDIFSYQAVERLKKKILDSSICTEKEFMMLLFILTTQIIVLNNYEE